MQYYHIDSNNVVQIAQSQIGNIGGRLYWSWYGFNNCGEGCACFVSWVINEVELIIAYAAATINDTVRVNTYLKHINSLNIKGQQKTNWYSMEAGCIVLAIDRIRNPVIDSEYTPIN